MSGTLLFGVTPPGVIRARSRPESSHLRAKTWRASAASTKLNLVELPSRSSQHRTIQFYPTSDNLSFAEHDRPNRIDSTSILRLGDLAGKDHAFGPSRCCLCRTCCTVNGSFPSIALRQIH